MNEKLDALEEKLDEISDKLDDLTSDIESSVESAVQDAVEDAVYSAVEDSVSGISGGNAPITYVLTQDGKGIYPVYAVYARRRKRGEEPYDILAWTVPNNSSTVIARYDSKEEAMNEMKNLSKHIRTAIAGGSKYYEMK